jgi:2-polyprenyl-3-methyl-5-hydroxy-6-metoxy-1,4-benzoquinol methylase
MLCPHCQDAEDVFSKQNAERELKDYRKNGPRKTTRILLDSLIKAGVSGLNLLDIGGGVGAIPHELIPAGLSQAIDVDASSAYIRVSKEEAAARGHADKMNYLHGDFVQLAPNIEAVDIVTLDRVVCCYPDVQALVDLSTERVKKFYALVYPRDNAVFRALLPLVNLLAFRIWGSNFRIFMHESKKIDAQIRAKGLSLLEHQKAGLWQVFVYQR